MPTRPRFHYTPPRGWMNDPMGITWRDGRYHLFFQCIPDSLQWTPQCSWGHASSADLLTWTDHPVAIAPGDGDVGCWSGCVGVADDGRATLLYTSIGDDPAIGRIRAATPDDGWEQWAKGAVVAEAPPDLPLHTFRDPFVLRDADGWRMLVGAGLEDGSACVLTYTSPTLTDWTYAGVLCQRVSTPDDPVWTGTAWECPQLVEVGGRHVLVVSVWDDDQTHYVAAAVGDYTDGRFVAERWQRLTYGPGHYAATAFADADGRPCLMMWIRGVGGAEAGWVGAQSLPMTMSLEGDRLAIQPHRVIESLPAVFEWDPHTRLDAHRGRRHPDRRR